MTMYPKTRPNIAANIVAALSLVVLCFAGCDVGGSEVKVIRVAPNDVVAGEKTEIRIVGAGFEWEYNAFTDTVTGEFEVKVGKQRLKNVEWIDTTELLATLPDDLEPGQHSVTVTAPQGEDTLDPAIRVLTADSE